MFLEKITIILSSLIFICGTTFAQTTTSTTGQFTHLKKGQAAPFDGTLFDPVAIAKIITDKQTAQQKCELQIGLEKDLSQAKCKSGTDLLSSALNIEKKKHQIIVSAQKEEIETLRELAKGNDSTLWATIGFGLGALTSVAIFFAAVEIAK